MKKLPRLHSLTSFDDVADFFFVLSAVLRFNSLLMYKDARHQVLTHLIMYKVCSDDRRKSFRSNAEIYRRKIGSRESLTSNVIAVASRQEYQ